MSINRTRWLDKLRPAGASSGGWTEGPMAPVETTDAATVDQRCPFKHRTGWRHNHSNSKLCVALRMGQANLLSISNCHPCAGPCSLHTQFSKRLDLCVSSLSRSPLVLHREKKKKKKNEFVRVILVQAIPLYRSKKNLPISDLDCHSCAGAMKQYPESQRSEEETPSSLRRGHATVSRGR